MTALGDLVGKQLGPTEWFEIDQERIDLFARATDDPQWIHTDAERAAKGPFGTSGSRSTRSESTCSRARPTQWIHTDAERAAKGPFGTTIAHGFLTLSLCVPLMTRALALDGYRMGINYGVNKVRFPAPVPSGSRVRAHMTVQSVEEVPGGEQGVVVATVEREGGDKPVCVAELVLRMLR